MQNSQVMVSGLKFKKREGIYSDYSGNCTFDPKACIARSYRWWTFVEIIGGKVIFNNYRYSATTAKHQSNVRKLLGSLGIEINAFIEAPLGLSELDFAVEHYNRRIASLREEIARKGSRKSTNEIRLGQIKHFEDTIALIRSLESAKMKEFYA